MAFRTKGRGFIMTEGNGFSFFSHATKNSNMVAMELVMAINPTCLFFFFIGNAHITDSLPTPAFVIIESGIGAWPRLPRP